MGSRWYRWLILAGVCFLLIPGSAYGSPLAHSARLSGTKAARACAHGRSLTARLRAADATYLMRWVPCVIRAERAQLGLGLTQDATMSQMLRNDLNRFYRLGYLATGRRAAVHRTDVAAVRAIAAQVCRARGFQNATYEYIVTHTLGFPDPTPLGYAKFLTRLFASRGAPFRSSRALFGIAARRGLLYERSNPHGAAFAVAAIVCS